MSIDFVGVLDASVCPVKLSAIKFVDTRGLVPQHRVCLCCRLPWSTSAVFAATLLSSRLFVGVSCLQKLLSVYFPLFPLTRLRNRTSTSATTAACASLSLPSPSRRPPSSLRPPRVPPPLNLTRLALRRWPRSQQVYLRSVIWPHPATW